MVEIQPKPKSDSSDNNSDENESTEESGSDSDDFIEGTLDSEAERDWAEEKRKMSVKVQMCFNVEFVTKYSKQILS